ncbi:MAG: hypothetical protein LKI25_02505 [Atopobiaceae bacterium]|jgi:hypothetical protein|nr:hypothetical protein [Atopobiaceae bacterium]MCI2173079.1 hypothetical protein [Atopobiaceae bacterium]MCI2208172.1 hypothetical protein [Atopobiaceae bacterium]
MAEDGGDMSEKKPGLVTRLRTWASTSPVSAFLVGFAVVVGVAALIIWFLFGSGLTAPAGFIYSQY